MLVGRGGEEERRPVGGELMEVFGWFGRRKREWRGGRRWSVGGKVFAWVCFWPAREEKEGEVSCGFMGRVLERRRDGCDGEVDWWEI